MEKLQSKNEEEMAAAVAEEAAFTVEQDMLISSPATSTFIPKLAKLPAAVLR